MVVVVLFWFDGAVDRDGEDGVPVRSDGALPTGIAAAYATGIMGGCDGNVIN